MSQELPYDSKQESGIIIEIWLPNLEAQASARRSRDRCGAGQVKRGRAEGPTDACYIYDLVGSCIKPFVWSWLHSFCLNVIHRPIFNVVHTRKQSSSGVLAICFKLGRLLLHVDLVPRRTEQIFLASDRDGICSN